MATVGYRVQVHHVELRGQFRYHGEPWQDRMTRAMFRAAVGEAPRRSGQLRASHRITKVWGNQYSIVRNIEASAPHAGWVHDGTDGHVSDTFMYLPPGGPGSKTRSPYGRTHFRGRRVKEVAGQDGNNWLERACGAVAMRYGAVRYA